MEGEKKRLLPLQAFQIEKSVKSVPQYCFVVKISFISPRHMKLLQLLYIIMEYWNASSVNKVKKHEKLMIKTQFLPSLACDLNVIPKQTYIEKLLSKLLLTGSR